MLITSKYYFKGLFLPTRFSITFKFSMGASKSKNKICNWEKFEAALENKGLTFNQAIYATPMNKRASLLKHVFNIICEWDAHKPISGTTNFISEQSEKFRDLTFLIQTFLQHPGAKLPDFISLPALPLFPKQFYWRDIANDYLVRKPVLEFFREFCEWFRDKRNDEYGQYFIGPEGIGKSVAVYFCACLAYSLGWVVVYFANCEEWVASGEENQPEDCEIARMRYAITVFEKSLANHYNEFTDPIITSPAYGNTWGELISYGKSRTTLRELQSVVGCLFNEIYAHKSHPVLLIADEINAIYERNMQDSRPYTLFASISGKAFANGYKLLSGTGHENFLKSLGSPFSGKGRCLRYFVPPTIDELKLLFQTSVCPPVLRDALNSLPEKQQKNVITKLCNIFRLPCLLRELGEFLTLKHGNRSPTWLEIRKEVLVDSQEINLEEKQDYYNELLQMFTKGYASVLHQVLDLSLIYQPTPASLAPINPIASAALISQLNEFYNNESKYIQDAIL